MSDYDRGAEAMRDAKAALDTMHAEARALRDLRATVRLNYERRPSTTLAELAEDPIVQKWLGLCPYAGCDSSHALDTVCPMSNVTPTPPPTKPDAVAEAREAFTEAAGAWAFNRFVMQREDNPTLDDDFREAYREWGRVEDTTPGFGRVNRLAAEQAEEEAGDGSR